MEFEQCGEFREGGWSESVEFRELVRSHILLEGRSEFQSSIRVQFGYEHKCVAGGRESGRIPFDEHMWCSMPDGCAFNVGKMAIFSKQSGLYQLSVQRAWSRSTRRAPGRRPERAIAVGALLTSEKAARFCGLSTSPRLGSIMSL